MYIVCHVGAAHVCASRTHSFPGYQYIYALLGWAHSADPATLRGSVVGREGAAQISTVSDAFCEYVQSDIVAVPLQLDTVLMAIIMCCICTSLRIWLNMRDISVAETSNCVSQVSPEYDSPLSLGNGVYFTQCNGHPLQFDETKSKMYWPTTAFNLTAHCKILPIGVVLHYSSMRCSVICKGI